MWKEITCPICGQEMKPKHGYVGDAIYLLRCPTQMDLPGNLKVRILSVPAYDTIKSHFEVEYRNSQPYYEQTKIYPFSIQSYDNETNIYMYDEDIHSNFIAAIPYLELPWNNIEKLINKIKTYTVFS